MCTAYIDTGMFIISKKFKDRSKAEQWIALAILSADPNEPVRRHWIEGDESDNA